MQKHEGADAAVQRNSALAPFSYSVFTTIWSASFVANFGTVIQTMAAAWVMTHLVRSPTMVALVQTATSLPTMLLAMFAGVSADRLGRRRQMLVAQAIAFLAASALTTITVLGVLTPWRLLGFTFCLGLAQALYLPAWQSSIGEQVPRAIVPAAIAFNAIGLNLARCIGPMAGGFVLALFGPSIAFGFNAVGFFSVFAALMAWRGAPAGMADRNQNFFAALREGLAYALAHPSLRSNFIRCALFAIFASCPYAFLPLIAKDLIGGGVRDYTLVQTVFGAGAVAAGLGLDRLRQFASIHMMAFGSASLIGVAMIIIGIDISRALTIAALLPIGCAWVFGFSIFNIATQFSSPPRLTGRLLAIYQMAISVGLAVGSATWGEMAHLLGVGHTLVLAGSFAVVLQTLAALRFVIPDHPLEAE